MPNGESCSDLLKLWCDFIDVYLDVLVLIQLIDSYGECQTTYPSTPQRIVRNDEGRILSNSPTLLRLVP